MPAVYTIHGHLMQQGTVQWENMKELHPHSEVGVEVTFTFSGSPPSKRDARRTVEKVLAANGVPWFRVSNGAWLVDLDRLRAEFQIPYEWLQSVVRVEPDYDVLAQPFNKSELRGHLRLVFEASQLSERETLWGEYPDEELAELVPLLKRAALDRDARRLFDRSEPVRRSAVLLVDVDHFKSVNDVHGHQAGDAALIGVAEVLRQVAGRRGTAYRYGGEELVLLLPDADEDEAHATAERLRAAVEARRFDAIPSLSVTVSVGIAVGVGGESFAQVFKAADDAMYEAKRGGRNRVARVLARLQLKSLAALT